jgi:hypothetical protein
MSAGFTSYIVQIVSIYGGGGLSIISVTAIAISAAAEVEQCNTRC